MEWECPSQQLMKNEAITKIILIITGRKEYISVGD